MSSKIKSVLRKFDQKRNAAIDNQKKRLQEIYVNFPRIKEIDSQISKTGILIAKALLNDPDSYEKNIIEVKKKMNDLKAEKAFLLTENNIPLDYLDIKYECSKCEDTGFLKKNDFKDVEKCTCLKQELVRESYSMSNIEQKLLKENFNTFDIDLFSDEQFEDEQLSPKQNMLSILDTAKSFCLNFNEPNDENLLFYGGTGLGKTFMCNCIAKNLLDRGKVVVYQTSFKLIEIVESCRFNKANSNLSRDDYDMIFSADLLIIDDLGTELVNSFTASELFNIINSRLLSGKKTVISTNLSLLDMGEIYTDRIFSRIASHFSLSRFYGPDIRWLSHRA